MEIPLTHQLLNQLSINLSLNILNNNSDVDDDDDVHIMLTPIKHCIIF